jgi:RNase P subunit RPR2
VYMMVEVAAASESGASLSGTTVAQIWMDYEVAFWSAVDDQQALTPITPIVYYVPTAVLGSITQYDCFHGAVTDTQFGTDTLTITYTAGAGTTITWPVTWPGAALVVQFSTTAGNVTLAHASSTAAVLSDPNGNQYHEDFVAQTGSLNGGFTYLFTQITPGVAMSLVCNFTASPGTVTSMQFWTYPMTLPSVGARKVLGEMHAMAGRMKQLERLLQVETAKLERKTEGKPIKPVKDEDSKYPEEEEESESSEEEDGPADAKQVDRIITRPGSALGLKPALKKRICDKCKQPGPHAWCAPEALEAVATGDPCRVCGWKRCVCASKAAQFDWRLELAEKRRKQEEGGKDQPAPSVPMAVSAGTNSQTANGDVQQEANLTLGNQGDDRQPRSLQDQKRLLGTAGGADDRTAARPQVPDERDRPLRAEESADLPRRQPIGPQAVGLPKGARSLDDGDYVVLKWLKQRLTGAGEKVNADVVEEAEVESSSASATARP